MKHTNLVSSAMSSLYREGEVDGKVKKPTAWVPLHVHLQETTVHEFTSTSNSVDRIRLKWTKNPFDNEYIVACKVQDNVSLSHIVPGYS